MHHSWKLRSPSDEAPPSAVTRSTPLPGPPQPPSQAVILIAAIASLDQKAWYERHAHTHTRTHAHTRAHVRARTHAHTRTIGAGHNLLLEVTDVTLLVYITIAIRAILRLEARVHVLSAIPTQISVRHPTPPHLNNAAFCIYTHAPWHGTARNGTRTASREGRTA